MNGGVRLGSPVARADARKVTRDPSSRAAGAPQSDHPPAGTDDLVGQRDGVFAPLVAVLVSTVAFIASQLLRPAGALTGVSELLVLGLSGALVVLSVGGLAAIALAWERIPYPRVLVGLYVGSMTIGMAVVAALDGGLDSIVPLAFMPIAAYLALVLPPRWSVPSLAGLLLLIAAAGAGGGFGEPGSAVVLFAMVAVSFVAGLLPRQAQQRLIARSVRLARTDELTGLLNRRGFIEEADHALYAAARAQQPVALALIDLDGFKQVNDRRGHAAGDELLAWVGDQFAACLPEAASAGRIGGDEFAILLPGLSAAEASAAASALQATLAPRTRVSIGIAAAREASLAAQSKLMPRADELLYRAKADPVRRVHLADGVAGEAPPAARAPRLRFADLRPAAVRRAAGGPPPSLGDPSWVLHGQLISLVTGAVVIGGAWLWGADTFWAQWLRWSGLVWIAAALAWALVLRSRDIDPERPSPWLLGPAVVLAGVGIMDAALADGGGIAAPVVGAFVLAIINLGSVAPRPVALRCTAVLAAFWLGAAVLGPADVLWAAPFSASLLVSSTVLGVVARGTLADAARTERRLALEDPLTGVLNRRAFVHTVMRDRTDAPQSPAGFIAVDLDDFKGVNDRHGHAEGDRVLTAVATTMQSALGDTWVVGRIGGDEFVAFTPLISQSALDLAARGLDGALSGVAAGSVGAAQFGVDGGTLAEVAAVADRRSYARKLSRRTAAMPAERTA